MGGVTFALLTSGTLCSVMVGSQTIRRKDEHKGRASGCALRSVFVFLWLSDGCSAHPVIYSMTHLHNYMSLLSRHQRSEFALPHFVKVWE